MSKKFQLGIDIGGTFTDFVFIDEATGEVQLDKTPTTPENLWEGIAAGIKSSDYDLSDCSLLAHGTTIGLNAFLERKGGKMALITTRGFRDVYEIGRHNRVEMYDLFYQKPKPLISREYRFEVTERLDANGDVIEPLVEEEVLEIIKQLKENEIESVAVCFLHSYLNPDHEERVRMMLEKHCPKIFTTISSELVREWREYERTSTTAINAYIKPVVKNFLDQISQEFENRGYQHSFYVNQSSGGLISANLAREKPVNTIMSGPAGGAVASAKIGELLDEDNIISFDMGGTSCDVSLTYEGITSVTVESKIEEHPVMVPMVEVHSIGAGGGSIAWLNENSRLKVGPQSAGAEPGPVCYDRGGQDITVTDANLLLGRLDPDRFLGGRMSLNQEKAAAIIDKKLADPLGLSQTEAAAGIIKVINTKMAHAIRALTVERGLHPNEFTLVAFGGAGPLHACEMAEEMEIPRVVIPVASGQFSALGIGLSELRQDFSRPVIRPLKAVEIADVNQVLDGLQQEANDIFSRQGIGPEELNTELAADLRYLGQEYTVTVPITGDRDELKAEWQELGSKFDDFHHRIYGHSAEGEPKELINLRLKATAEVSQVKLEKHQDEGEKPPAEAYLGELETYFAGEDRYLASNCYRRELLKPGNRISGPAIIEEFGSTAVLSPDWQLEVDSFGNLIFSRKE